MEVPTPDLLLMRLLEPCLQDKEWRNESVNTLASQTSKIPASGKIYDVSLELNLNTST